MFNTSNPWSFGLKIKPHTTLINLHINHFIYNGSFGFFYLMQHNYNPFQTTLLPNASFNKVASFKKIRISYETNLFQFLQRFNGGS
jgi:hypothetical protein